VTGYLAREEVTCHQQLHEQLKDAFSSELAWLEHADHAPRSRILIETHLRLGAAHLASGETSGSAAPEAPPRLSRDQLHGVVGVQ
jgi:hypothetical protein